MPNVSNLSDALEQVERLRRSTLFEFGYRSHTTTNDADEEETGDSSLLLSAADFLAPAPAMDLNEDTELMHRTKVATDAVAAPAKVVSTPQRDPSYYNFINSDWMLQIKNSVRCRDEPPPPPSIENLNLYGSEATHSVEPADSSNVTAVALPDPPSDRNLPKFISENLASNECAVASRGPVVVAAPPAGVVSDVSGAHHFNNQQSTGSHRSNHSNSNSVYSNSNEISKGGGGAQPPQQHAIVSLNDRPKLYEFREKKWSLFHSLIAESSGEFFACSPFSGFSGPFHGSA